MLGQAEGHKFVTRFWVTFKSRFGIKIQCLISGEQGCPLDSDQKLVVGQPNSIQKSKKLVCLDLLLNNIFVKQ